MSVISPRWLRFGRSKGVRRKSVSGDHEAWASRGGYMPDLGGAEVVGHMRGGPFGVPGRWFDLARASTRRPAPLARIMKTLNLPGGAFVAYAQPTLRKIKFRVFETLKSLSARSSQMIPVPRR